MPMPGPKDNKMKAGKRKAGKLMMHLSSPKLRKQQVCYVQMNGWIDVLSDKITKTIETDPPNIPYPEPWCVGAAVDVGSKPLPKTWKRVRTKMLLNELGIPVGAHKEWLVEWSENQPNISRVKCTRLHPKEPSAAPDADPSGAGDAAASAAPDSSDDEWATFEE